MARPTGEAALRRIVERTSSPMAILDGNGVFRVVNGAFARIFGENVAIEDFDDVEFAALLSEDTASEFRADILPVALYEGFEGSLNLWRKGPISELNVRLSPVLSDAAEDESRLLSVEVLGEHPALLFESNADRGPPQRDAAQWLAPILPVADGIIVVPVIGTLDARRSSLLLRLLLSGISSHRAKAVILDVTGLSGIDQRGADYLAKAVMGARLKGAHTVVSGVSAETADALAGIIVPRSDIVTVRDLKTGLTHALAWLGMRLEATRERTHVT